MAISINERQRSDLRIEDVTSFGTDQGLGNLVGIQPYMRPSDFATAESYFAKLDGYLAAAQREGWLHPKTVVIFPEYVGTWLVAVDEHESVYHAPDTDRAMRNLILRRLPGFLAALLRARGQDRAADAVFRLKADKIARLYQDTFSRLAARYRVTVMAGSLILPSPELVHGELRAGRGVLRNVGLVFGPDGRALPHIVHKVFPVKAEMAFLSGATLEELPVFDTPAGRLAPLICADSWYPETYAALNPHAPQIIAVPNNETQDWEAPWIGYIPGPGPDDVDPHDVGELVCRDAWLKYALAGRMKHTSAVAGMQVFFHGQMWDLKSYGQTIVVTRDSTWTAPSVEGAALVNYWIGS